jgi:hypothetical protein
MSIIGTNPMSESGFFVKKNPYRPIFRGFCREATDFSDHFYFRRGSKDAGNLIAKGFVGVPIESLLLCDFFKIEPVRRSTPANFTSHKNTEIVWVYFQSKKMKKRRNVRYTGSSDFRPVISKVEEALALGNPVRRHKRSLSGFDIRINVNAIVVTGIQLSNSKHIRRLSDRIVL